jgi:hypothetical protein
MSIFWWYSTENLSPLVTAEFLARQRRLLLPAQYAREHENRWVDQADASRRASRWTTRWTARGSRRRRLSPGGST